MTRVEQGYRVDFKTQSDFHQMRIIAALLAPGTIAMSAVVESGTTSGDSSQPPAMTMLELSEATLSSISRELGVAKSLVTLEQLIEGNSLSAMQVVAHVQLLAAYADLSEQILSHLNTIGENERTTYRYAEITYKQLRLETTGSETPTLSAPATGLIARSEVGADNTNPGGDK